MRKRNHKVAGKFIGNITHIDQIPPLDESHSLHDRIKRICERKAFQDSQVVVHTTINTIQHQNGLFEEAKRNVK